jgi:trimeric autotransporter adhesin
VVKAKRFRAFTLNRIAIQDALSAAPKEFTAAARRAEFVLSLPAPAGGFQRFTVNESPVMEEELARKHPDIKTYSGRGIDDTAATICFDLTPLGFHASVRSQSGNWYIDPCFHLEQSLYVSYFGRDLENQHGPFMEQEVEMEALISVDHSYYRAGKTVKLRGAGFGAKTTITITISDLAAKSPTRNLTVETDENGSFELQFQTPAA